jgi:hypothetical protein
MELAAVREDVRAACRDMCQGATRLLCPPSVPYLGFGKVADSAIDSTFEEMDFGKDHFVVETFEFGEKVVDEDKGGLELLGLELSVGVLDQRI